MPNNDNSQFNNNNENNSFDLPNLNNEQPKVEEQSVPSNPVFQQPQQQEVQPVSQEPKPIIEIPQEYYDKIAKEKEEKRIEEQKQQEKELESKQAKSDLGKLFTLVIFNAVLIFGLIYLYLNVKEIFIFVIPVYIIILSVINALTDKKNSNQPLANMIGGMLVAVITFILSTIQEDKIDLWTYYAIASAIIAFLGIVTSSIITKIIADPKSVKALESIGIVLYIAALIGIPYYFYNKYPEEFYKTVFLKQTEVKAENLDEFIIKTLKNRYNVSFVCETNPKNIDYHIDQYNRSITDRHCYEESILKNAAIELEYASTSDKERLAPYAITITSIAYNEGDNQYIIQDNYMSVLMLKKFKEELINSLVTATGTNEVDVYLYPEKNCSFIGDCPPNDSDYYDRLAEEINPDNQYKSSTELNFEKYLNYEAKDFINDYGFKFNIEIKGIFTPDSYTSTVDKVLTVLNNKGLKNTSGYTIILKNNDAGDIGTKVYEANGDTNDEKVFKTLGEAN